MGFPKTKKELLEQYGQLRLVHSAEGWYAIHEKLLDTFHDWVILPKAERAQNVVACAYFENAFVHDLTELRFDDVTIVKDG